MLSIISLLSLLREDILHIFVKEAIQLTLKRENRLIEEKKYLHCEGQLLRYHIYLIMSFEGHNFKEI